MAADRTPRRLCVTHFSSMGPISVERGRVISGHLANRFGSRIGTNSKLFRDYNEAVLGFGFLDDLWREIALPCKEQAQDTSFQRRQNNLAVQGPIKIASLPLKQFKPEDISLDVDGENIILHGQHRSEGEDGFENNEFKKVIKLPDGVDPTTVKSRVIKNLKSGSVLLLESNRRVEEKDDGKFVVKLDLCGFKAEDIKVQLRGHELTVTGKHKSDDQGFYFSRDYSHRVLLPDDADLGSVTSRLSKNGLLIIEASRDPALRPSNRNVEVSMEVDEPQPEEQAKQVVNGGTEEQNKN